MLATVDSYTVFKFIHVLFAVVWVGGALMLQVLAEFALRSTLPGRAAEFAREAEWVGMRVFLPSSIIVLLVGLWLVHDGGWGFGSFWIIAALVAFVLSVVTGAGFIGPESGRLAKEIEAQGADAPAIKDRIRRILMISRVELAVLIFIVFLMVTKIGQ
jgi:uncharacterized membrane protein